MQAIRRTPHKNAENDGIGRSKLSKDNGRRTDGNHIRDTIRAMYYTSLTDPEWSKAHPRGFLQGTLPSSQNAGKHWAYQRKCNCTERR